MEQQDNSDLHPQDQDEKRVFEQYIERKPSSLFVRFLITQRHLTGLLLGGGYAYLRERKANKAKFSFTIDIFLRLFIEITATNIHILNAY